MSTILLHADRRVKGMPPMNATRSTVPVEEAVERISNGECRAALEYLVDHENQAISIDRLATVLREDGSPPVQDRQDGAESHTIALHHAHMPRLDDMGVVHYNPRCRTAIYQCPDRGDGVVDSS